MRVVIRRQVPAHLRRGILMALAALVMLLIPAAQALATALPNTITENMTLTAAGSPYTGSAVTIESGATVQVEMGAIVKVSTLTVNGTLKAEGTKEKPILFTSTSDSGAGQWGGINLNSGSGASVLDHVEVRYAGSFLNAPAIKVNGVSPTITNSTVRNSTYTGIRVENGGSPEIAHNAVLSNGGAGISYSAGSGKSGEVKIHDNLIEGNSYEGITVSTTGSSVKGGTLGGNTLKGNGSSGGYAIYYSGNEVAPDIDDNTLTGNNKNSLVLSGTLNQSGTWTDRGYHFRIENGALTVGSSATLTIGPGFTVKGSQELAVNGTLKAEGSEEKPILFTSQTDTGPGQWAGIAFNSSSGASVLDHVEVRYAGLFSNAPAIKVNGVSPTITHSTVRKNTYAGIRTENGGSPEIAHNKILSNGGQGISYSAGSGKSGEVKIHDNLVEGNSFEGISVSTTGSSVKGGTLGGNTLKGNGSSGGYAIYYSGGDLAPDVDDNTLSANNKNYVVVSGTLNQSGTWTDRGYHFRIENGALTVGSSATLTIGSGFIVKGGQELAVNGTLKAEGTAEKPILFTSQTDTGPGQWAGIAFNSGSGASVLDHVEVRYAGLFSNAPAIKVNGVSPTITNSTVRNSTYTGIRVENGGSPEIAHNAVLANGGAGISYSAGSGKSGEVKIHDNLIEGNSSEGISVSTLGSSVKGGTLGGNTVKGNGFSGGYAIYYSGNEVAPDIDDNTLAGNNKNYVALSGALNQSGTWTDRGYHFRIENGALAVGSSATLTIGPGFILKGGPILAVNGTLKAEGTAEDPILLTSIADSGAGQWGGISLNSGSGASVLDHVEVRYAGSFLNAPAIKVNGVSPTITSSAIRNNSQGGIKAVSASPTIKWTSFTGNSIFAVKQEGTGTADARHNYWGCASGPAPTGCGDAISGKVNWEPQAEKDTAPGHCQGQETQCGVGADPVSLATGYLTYTHRDLLLTNKSRLPLEFARAYNSGDQTDTGLGPGWSQTGLTNATELENGDVLVRRQDGRQDVFLKAGSSYAPPSGVTDSLAKSESGTFQLATLEGTVYRFDQSGRIASITDDHGLKTTYGYNTEGRLATITDPSAQSLTFSYNASNHITLVKDSTGREVKYTYSVAGDLATVTDALGGVTEYTYDSAHRLKTIKDPRGNVMLKNTFDGKGRVVEQRDGLENLWTLEYEEGETIVTEPEGGEIAYGFDSQDRVVSEEDQLGHTTTTSYDAAGNIDEIVKPGGAKWVFGHDAAGNLTSVVDPEEGERTYEYDGLNRLTSFTDERGESWSYEWDEGNDLVEVTDPAEGETTFTHDASGLPLTVTDPNEHTTTFTYDLRGNRLTAKDALEDTTTYAYNSRNQLTSKTEPGLKAETYGRNALGDLLSTTTPESNNTEYTYDANGMPTQVKDPAGNLWKIERNAMERPTAYVDPLEQKTKVTYDGNLRPIKVTDRRGKETTYAYDLADQPTEVKRPGGEVWKYSYDGRGNRSGVVDPRGNESTYDFDLLDRMTEVDEPLEATTSYEFDPAGNLTSLTDPRENTTEFRYDGLGRLTQIDQPLEKTTSFTYDGFGNRLTRTTALGTLEYAHDTANRLTKVSSGESTLRSYGYDAANRLTSATDAGGHKIEVGYTEEGRPSSIKDGQGQSLTRSYDTRGNLLKQVDGRGIIEYGYDKLGRMTSLIDPQGKSLGFGYDPEGGLTEVTRPNGVTTTNAYDNAGRLAETISKTAEPLTVLESLKYDYDAAGNVISKADQRLGQETSYSYDGLNRLAEFNPPGEGSVTYGYDAAGNRTEADGTIYSFNALNQPTESSTGTAYSYDDAGRLTAEVNGSEETTYTWDPFNHLAKVEGPSGNVTYSFDGLERLSERKSGEATKVFHYGDLGDMPSYTANGEGKITTTLLQGPSGLVEQRSGEATNFPLVDGHGDVTAIATSAGEVESRQTFDPWGSQLSGPSLEMGYLGAWERLSDSATGLIQMGARSYAPSLGAFASEDPVLGHLGISVSSNRYPYAWNNPVNRYDLSGRDVLLGVPICIMACGPDPEEVSERAKSFAKSDVAEWFGARGDELIRTFECIAERVVQQPGPAGCQEAAEQWKPDPDAPDEPPKFPPPGIPGKGPVPAPRYIG